MTKALRIRATAKDIFFLCPACEYENRQPTRRLEIMDGDLITLLGFHCSNCKHWIDYVFDEVQERVTESKRLAREADIRYQLKAGPRK